MPTALISEDTSSVLALDMKFTDAMKLLGVSRSTMYRLMHRCEFTHRKVGATWRFSRKELLEKAFRDAPLPKIA